MSETSERHFPIAQYVNAEEYTFLMIKYGDNNQLSDAFTKSLDVSERIQFRMMERPEQEDVMMNFFISELT